MIHTTAPKDAYVAHFREIEAARGGRRAGPLERLRREAIARFAETGFPTAREEDWKYTRLDALARTAFRLPPRGIPGGPEPAGLEAPGWSNRLVLVNGRYAPALSRLPSLPAGASVGSLAEALAADPGIAEAHLGASADLRALPFAALNTAFLDDGVIVRIPDHAIVDEPIHIVFLSRPNGGPTVSHPRVLVLAGRHSQATVVERYAGEGIYFTNAVTEIAAAEGAVIEHCKLERESDRAFHVGIVSAAQSRDSSLTTHAVLLGGELVRNDVTTVLGAEGASCALNGLYMTEGSQHVDNRTLIDHASPHCASNETYKGVLDGRSRAVFNGEIVVRADARQSDAHQLNKNLVLSDEALVWTKPRLRILNNDVRCTHGATVGMLDEDALFYLRSRGLDERGARALLVYAFVSDILTKIKARPLRAELDALVAARLPESMRLAEIA
jgi:Fe-S cluster assembly protein SufD